MGRSLRAAFSCSGLAKNSCQIAKQANVEIALIIWGQGDPAYKRPDKAAREVAEELLTIFNDLVEFVEGADRAGENDDDRALSWKERAEIK